MFVERVAVAGDLVLALFLFCNPFPPPGAFSMSLLPLSYLLGELGIKVMSLLLWE